RRSREVVASEVRVAEAGVSQRDIIELCPPHVGISEVRPRQYRRRRVVIRSAKRIVAAEVRVPKVLSREVRVGEIVATEVKAAQIMSLVAGRRVKLRKCDSGSQNARYVARPTQIVPPCDWSEAGRANHSAGEVRGCQRGAPEGRVGEVLPDENAAG